MASMKTLLKAGTPTPVWRALRDICHPVRAFEEYKELKRWKDELAAAPYTGRQPPTQSSFDVASLTNRLPNLGGLPLDPKKAKPEKIFGLNQSHPRERWSGVPGFEGMALDDALNWLEEYRHFSFVPLASAIARIVKEHLGIANFSILELGCGGGGFRPILESYGAVAYLGLDANPIPFRYSPFMQASPQSYRLLNLQERVDFGVQFDVLCSFEVLEHIREDRLDELMYTIRTHIGPESLFLGTAAFTEDYDVHITVHEREWWLKRFEQNGLILAPGADKWSDLIFASHPFNWSRSTSSVFVLKRA